MYFILYRYFKLYYFFFMLYSMKFLLYMLCLRLNKCSIINKYLKIQNMKIAKSSSHKQIKFLNNKLFQYNKENQPTSSQQVPNTHNYLQARSQSIEWLYRAQMNLNFSRSTLFLSVGLIDQLLAKNIYFLKENQQILTASILMISTKFNQVYPPSVRKINLVCVHDYPLHQFEEIQAKILQKIEFTINPDQIYGVLAEFQAKYQGRTLEIVQETIQTALLHPYETFKYGTSFLIQGLTCYLNGGIFERSSNKQNQAIEVIQIRKSLTRLRSGSLKRLSSPSKA